MLSERESLVSKQVTTTIPIVMARGSDPVRNGLIASFALPGGNVTGLSDLNVDLITKRLELLKEVAPLIRPDQHQLLFAATYKRGNGDAAALRHGVSEQPVRLLSAFVGS
jgi:hypothetical protein